MKVRIMNRAEGLDLGLGVQRRSRLKVGQGLDTGLDLGLSEGLGLLNIYAKS